MLEQNHTGAPLIGENPDWCPNCGLGLTGRFCSGCGQKRIEPEERRLVWFLAELVRSLVGADGRLRRTLTSFVLRPGELGAAWLAGRRAHYTAPLPLFLLINLVYFVAPPLTDLNLPLEDQMGQSWYGELAQELVSSRRAERGQSWEEVRSEFAAQATSLAKLLVILHPLLLAPVLWLLLRRKRIYLVDHLAIGFHLWTAVLALTILIPMLGDAINSAFGVAPEQWHWKLVLGAGCLWFTWGTLARAYRQPVWLAGLQVPIVLIGGAVGHILIYRPVLFFLAFATS